MEGDDLELDSEGDTNTGSSSHAVRKNIAIKLKPSPKSRGRPKKVAKTPTKTVEQDFDDNFMLEAPIFKTMEPLEPIHRDQRLHWDHRVNLIGEKVVDPVIHCCEKCTLPILIYGRMIPCKHVFCLDCAKKTEKSCARCEEPVQRVEQSALGTVFVCIYGGTKLGVSGCRRTYLSQRDLQAHVDHRHLKRGLPEQSKPHHHAPSSVASSGEYMVTSSSRSLPMDMHRQHGPPTVQGPAMFQRPSPEQMRLPPPVLPSAHHPPPVNPLQLRPQGLPLPQTHLPPPTHHMTALPPPMMAQRPNLQQQPPNLSQQPPPQAVSRDSYSSGNIPVMASNRGNLISVTIQDERSEFRGDFQNQPPPNYHLSSGPPPVTFSPNQPPPTHHPPPGHFPPTTMTPPPHQPPPVSFAGPPPMSHGPPSHYSAAQMSKPPPVSHPPPHHSVPPPLTHLPPPRPGAPLTTSPHHPLSGGPPRMGPPSSQPHHGGPPPHFSGSHHRYEDSQTAPPFGQSGAQSPRIPWTGPPNRLPPPHTPTSTNLGPPQSHGDGQYKPFY